MEKSRLASESSGAMLPPLTQNTPPEKREVDGSTLFVLISYTLFPKNVSLARAFLGAASLPGGVPCLERAPFHVVQQVLHPLVAPSPPYLIAES